MADNFGLKIGIEGEKEFKKALADINASFKVLKSEMNLVTSEFGKNENSVGSLTAKNEVLNKEIEAQKQKIETLRSALANAAESFGENDKRTQAWQIQLNNAEAALNDMEHELSENGKAIDELSDSEEDAEKGSKEMAEAIKESGDTAEDSEGKFSKFKSVVADVGKVTAAAVAAIGTACIAAGKAVWDMANDTASAGDAIDKTSQKIGISAEAYQEWSYVFERCGSDVDKLQVGMKTLSTVIADAGNGSSSAAEKLSQVGLSIEDLNGKSQDEQLSIVIGKLQEMGSGAERTAAATDLLGKSGVDMAAVLNMSAEETQALIDEAHDYGMVMSNEAVAASAAFEDSLTKLNTTFSGLKNRMMGDVLPALTSILDGLSDLIAGNEGAAESIKIGVENLITEISSMIPQVVTLISTVAEAILASAPSIITALAQGIIDAIPQLLPTVVQIITELVTALIELLPQVVEAGIQIIVSVIQGIAEALPTLIPKIVEVVMAIVQTLVDNLPLILDAALQLITGLAQGILNAIPVLIEALPAVIDGIITFILSAIPQIIETGIRLLTSLIGALPEIITAIVEAIPQIISGIISAVLAAIPQLIQAGIDLLVALIGALPDIIVTIVNAIPDIIAGIINAVLDNLPLIMKAGFQLFVALIENLPRIIVEIVKAVPQIISGIVTALGKGVTKMAEVGANLVKGLWNGIQGLASWLWDKVSGWISGIWDGICDFFGIASPSKEMAWIGEMMTKGLANGIEDSGEQAVKAVNDMGSDIDSAMTDIAKNMKTAIPTDFDMSANAKVTASMPDVSASGSVSLDGIVTGIVSGIKEILADLVPGGDTVIPVYIGGNLLDEVIVTAQQRVSLRSGGR